MVRKNLVVSVKKRSPSTLIIVLIVGMIKRSLSTVRHQEKLRKIRPRSRLNLNLKKMLFSDPFVPNITDRAENEKYLAKRQADAKAAQEKRTFGKNENPEPNLIASTKLMLRDTFRTDKRMGRADFWWGYLGITMLTVLLTFPPCAYCPNLAGGGTGFCDDGNGDYGLFFDVFLYFRNVYGFDQTFSGC